MQRRYVEVDGRRVLYRRAGSGPPVVMLHGSPGNSAMLGHEMAAAGERFTVYALDTPGFGGSDPLPGDDLTVQQLAEATARALDSLGLPPCPVYGTHTGALIAVELGAGWPERVSGVLAEGLPIFTQDEIDTLFVGYFESMIPDPLGGHLTSTFVRFRDQFIWFPWLSRDVRRLNPVDRPTAEEIDHWVMMFYRSCKTYRPAYRAACFHGHQSFVAAERLTVPAIYMASAEDMLFPHLDRLPPLKEGQRIERLPHDPDAKYAAIADLLATLPQAPQDVIPSPNEPVGSEPAVQFVSSGGGDVFVRSYGRRDAPALVLLHDAPGSGLALESIARELADTFLVLVPDLPGNGESDAAPGSPLEAGADAVLAIADALGLDKFAVGGLGCGAAVAATLAQRQDPRVQAIVVEAVPRPDAVIAAAIAPDLPLTPEGSHWIKAWLMVRDGQIYAPWFDGRIAAQRKTQGNFDAGWLHDQTFEIMKARETYHLLPRAAYAFDGDAALAGAAVRIVRAADGALASELRSIAQPTGTLS